MGHESGKTIAIVLGAALLFCAAGVARADPSLDPETALALLIQGEDESAVIARAGCPDAAAFHAWMMPRGCDYAVVAGVAGPTGVATEDGLRTPLGAEVRGLVMNPLFAFAFAMPGLGVTPPFVPASAFALSRSGSSTPADPLDPRSWFTFWPHRGGPVDPFGRPSLTARPTGGATPVRAVSVPRATGLGERERATTERLERTTPRGR